MHFFKTCGLVLSFMTTAAAWGTSSNQDPVVKHHYDNLTHILQVFDEALKPELTRIAAAAPSDADGLCFFHHAIAQEMPTIKRKFTHAFNNQLNHEQQELVFELLQDLKELSQTTTQDLMFMAEGCCTYELRNALNEALEKYCPDTIKQNLQSHYDEGTRILKRKEIKARWKQFEQVDLHNANHTMLKQFMCKYAYLQEMCIMAQLPIEHNLVHKALIRMDKTISLPFVVFNDFYVVPGWQDEFSIIGFLFDIMHDVCTQLLEVTTPQNS